MKLAQYLIILIFAVAFGIFNYYFCKKSNASNKQKYYYILTIILGLVFFLRFMLGADQLRYAKALIGGPFGYNNEVKTVFAMLSTWLTYAIVLLAIISPYFKLKYVKNIIKLCVLPLCILFTVTLPYETVGLCGEVAYNGTSIVASIRAILLALEISLLIGIGSFSLIDNGIKIDKKEWASTLCFLGFIILVSMPSYTLQVLFGDFPIFQPVTKLTVTHRILVYLGIIIPILFFIVLKNKDEKTKKFVLLYLSLATMITFTLNYKFENLAHATSWPLHLCNTAMYIIPLCLIFKWDKLFYFTVFINVLGAFIALLMPSYDGSLNVFSTRVVSFFINHHLAFYMPLLMIALGIYKRPKLKQFIYSMVAFSIYFVVIIIINAWFSNYGSVDYFFLNSDFVVSKLGNWAERTRDITFVINLGNIKLVLYPLYHILFFIVYVMLGLAVWFIYEQFFMFSDLLCDIKNKEKTIKMDRLALESKLNGRSESEPMEKDFKDKVVVSNFSKKYASSKNFAVENASFSLDCGKIIGFIGPNGAGKSTIIKSMVGIQPFSSGSINICGYDIKTQSIQSKMQIGYVPDHYALYENLTGREYINYIADLYEVNTIDRTNRIDKYLKLLSLENAFDNKIKTYSHGMKQKIAIISALVHNPKLWILDEPLTGLDPSSIFEVKEVMKEHAKNGNIVFFSSHIIDVVEKLCDEIILIKNGNIIAKETVNNIEKKGKSLEKYYLDKIAEPNNINTINN